MTQSQQFLRATIAAIAAIALSAGCGQGGPSSAGVGSLSQAISVDSTPLIKAQANIGDAANQSDAPGKFQELFLVAGGLTDSKNFEWVSGPGQAATRYAVTLGYDAGGQSATFTVTGVQQQACNVDGDCALPGDTCAGPIVSSGRCGNPGTNQSCNTAKDCTVDQCVKSGGKSTCSLSKGACATSADCLARSCVGVRKDGLCTSSTVPAGSVTTRAAVALAPSSLWVIRAEAQAASGNGAFQVALSDARITTGGDTFAGLTGVVNPGSDGANDFSQVVDRDLSRGFVYSATLTNVFPRGSSGPDKDNQRISLTLEKAGDVPPPPAQCHNLTVNSDPGQRSAAVSSTQIVGLAPVADPDSSRDGGEGGETDSCTLLVDSIAASCANPSVATWAVGAHTVSVKVAEALPGAVGGVDGGDVLAESAASCTVTVVDAEAPQIVCPPGVTVASDAGRCGAAAPALGAPIATDNCAIRAVASDAPAVFPVGTTTVTWTATDVNGKQAACTQSVTVVDGGAPKITCPASVIQECTSPAGAVAAFTVTASDDCGIAGSSCSIPSGSAFALGSTADHCSASDLAGNSASCDFAVIVRDTTPPTITSCPADATPECTGGGAAIFDPGSATAVDACDAAVTLLSDKPASYALGADVTVTYTALDHAGNVAACQSHVRTVDTTPPVFAGDSLAARTVVGNCAGAAVVFAPPTATDLCTTAVVNCTPVSGLIRGATVSTCTATDASGNVATAQLTVTVLEPLTVYFDTPHASGDANGPTSFLFSSGSVVQHKVGLLNCQGQSVSVARNPTVAVRLGVVESKVVGGAVQELAQVVSFDNVGGANGLMTLQGSSLYEYNLKTNGYESGTQFNASFFRSRVTVSYNAAPGLVAGRADYILESK